MAGREYPASAAGRHDRSPIDRCRAALFGGPAIEKPPLGGLLVVGHHDIELTPVAPRQGPALQAGGLKSHQQREQRIRQKDRCSGNAEAHHADIDGSQQRRSSRSAPATADARPAIAGPAAAPRNESHRERTRSGRSRRMPASVAPGSVNCVDRHRTSPPTKPKSAAELTLGGRHFARGARINRDRRTQRPRQTLEAGFGDMVAVLAI